MVPMDEDQDKKNYDNSRRNWIIVAFGVIVYLLTKDKGIFAFAYFCQLIEAIGMSKTMGYLCNVIALRNTGKEINKLKAVRPTITFTI